MVAIFGAPRRYIQGPGALDELRSIKSLISKSPLIIVDAEILPMIRPRLDVAFIGIEHLILPFRGEVTYATIAELIKQSSAIDTGAVVGIGGGKEIGRAHV